MSIAAFKNLVKERYTHTVASDIFCALDWATKAYAEKQHPAGFPYVDHSVSVAEILLMQSAPAEVVISALLHDVLGIAYSDGQNLQFIRARFSDSVARLTEDVTKLEEATQALNYDSTELDVELVPRVAPTLRRTPMAVIIWLISQLVWVSSAKHMPNETRQQLVNVVLGLAVPLAGRLGMQEVRRQLEDAAFLIQQPEQHNEISDRYSLKSGQVEVEAVLETIRGRLESRGLRASVKCASVSSYWLYQQEKEQNRIPALRAARPILITVDDTPCVYQALGIVHEIWPPHSTDIRDYIADPRPNGYRAVHTKVRDGHGETLTIIIRTGPMNLVAEKGLMAKWLGISEDRLPTLPQWQEPGACKISILSPHGDLYTLDEGSTPIDFAYEIHRELGNQMTGVIINGKTARLDAELRTGDVVRILTSGVKIGPSPEWLKIAKTSRALKEIRRWQKKTPPDEAALDGRDSVLSMCYQTGIPLSEPEIDRCLEEIAAEWQFSSKRDLLITIGRGGDENPERNAASVVSKILESITSADSYNLPGKVSIMGNYTGFPRQLAQCCLPRPPFSIVAHVPSKGPHTIHLKECTNVPSLDPIVDARWNLGPNNICIKVKAVDRMGLLAGILIPFSEETVNLSHVEALRSIDGTAEILLEAEHIPANRLESLLAQLRSTPEVHNVTIHPQGTKLRSAAVPPAVQHAFRKALNHHSLMPVTGPSFFGRDQELDQLTYNLRLANQGDSQAILLWGPRRIGKTSLLLQFVQTVLDSQDYLTVFIDMQELSGRNVTSFLETVAAKLVDGLEIAHIQAPSYDQMRIEPLGRFRRLIQEISRYDRRQIVLILDEIEVLANLREDRESLESVLLYFRSIIQHGTGMRLMLSGGGALASLLQLPRASSLLNVTIRQELGSLTPEDSRKMVITNGERSGVSYRPEAVSRLISLTNGHPYYLQLLCGELIDRSVGQRSRSIQREDVDQLLIDWLPILGEEYFSHLWGHDSNMDRRTTLLNRSILTRIALTAGKRNRPVNHYDIVDNSMSGAEGQPKTQRVLKNLVDLRTIEKTRTGQYRIRMPLLTKWVCDNSPVE